MEETEIHENRTFSVVDYSEKKLRDSEFVKCEFVSCNFNKSNLKNNIFEDCTFKECNFSMVDIEGTGVRNAAFSGCKMLGVDFPRCSSFSFTECHLNYCNLFGGKLRKTAFKRCTLKDVELTEADLTTSEFFYCELSSAKFSNTILEKADFRTAINFVIDPDSNKMKKTKFSMRNL